MKSDFITIILSFIEGFLLIISPCILPILPIILASSLTGSKKRPLGIIIGFTLSFALFAFFSRQLVQISGIDLNWIRHISYLILILLGIIMMSSYLSEKFSELTQKFINKNESRLCLGPTNAVAPKLNLQRDFLSGLILGTLIAIIWTPCAGPILASVIVQTVLQKTTLISFFILLSFALGVAIPMLIITLYGRKIINAFGLLKTKAVLLRQILGAIIIMSVMYMIYLEEGTLSTSAPQTTIKTLTVLENGLWRPYTAPEIEGIESWINSQPLTISQLKGKVVLIDFWAYSCINCIRTLPYLKDWYLKYHKKGLEIIGVHAPEFDFEKKLDNVEKAVKRYGIQYPVALDNQFSTWRNYKNQYWPAHYLINKEGKVVYEHFGEGQYEITENNIRFLLGINEFNTIKPNQESTFYFSQTPETYLGYARANPTLSPDLFKDKVTNYTFSNDLSANAWSLRGNWQVDPDKIISKTPNAAVKISFKAAKVFIVMGNNTPNPIKVKVLLNGERIVVDQGKDIDSSAVLVNKYSIYELVNSKQFQSGILEVMATEPGIEIYTFTFGN